MESDIFKRNLHLLAWQFLRESGLKDAQHELERVTGVIFDMEYFTELILAGALNKADEYFQGFIKPEKNPHPSEIYAIQKQKYMEALESGDKKEARRIIDTELSVFEGTSNASAVSELRKLLRIKNLSVTRQMHEWGDITSSREKLVTELVEMIRQDPDISEKLEVPTPHGRIGVLASNSWRHQYSACGHFLEYWTRNNLTLLKDHSCQTGGRTIPALEWHPQTIQPSDKDPVSEGVNLELPEPSQVVHLVSSPRDTLSPEHVNRHGLDIPEGENLEHVNDPEPSQVVHRVSSPVEILSQELVNDPELEIPEGGNLYQVSPLSPQVLMTTSPERAPETHVICDLNSFPDNDEAEVVFPSNLMLVQLDPFLPASTSSSVIQEESESSNARMQKRVRFDN